MSSPIFFIAEPSINLADVFNGSNADPVAHALEWWESKGLLHIVTNHGGRIAASTCNGPDNTSGIWVTVWPEHSESPKPIGYHAAKQTWTKVRSANEDSPAIYVGWKISEPPTPSDLSLGNPYGLSCEQIKLCDGNSWAISEIREPLNNGMLTPTASHDTDLPKLVKRDLNGNLCNPVKKQFEQLWEESGQWFDIWCEIHFQGRTSFPSDQALEFGLQVLQLRYRICDLTNDALNLLDTSNFQDIISNAIGWPSVKALLESHVSDDGDEKKNHDAFTRETANGSSGLEDSGRNTDPLEANSTAPVDSGGGAR
ncbi:MAG: hypothetical protein ABJZ55_02000 [Fuerstiella sp.]